MKNQNDLIFSIVAIVLALIIAGVCFGTRREPQTIPAPEKVNLAKLDLPAGDVVMANSLPGGSNGGGGGAAAGMGGGASPAGRGGPSGFATPGGGGKGKVLPSLSTAPGG